jgi:transcriptional regulator with PAS, ATPase and Fis domain
MGGGECIGHLLALDPGVRAIVISGYSAEDPPVVTIKDAEKMAIRNALAITKGQKLKAASLLQIDYKTLVKKMKDYHLE